MSKFSTKEALPTWILRDFFSPRAVFDELPVPCVDVVMTLDAVHIDGSFILSNVRDLAPIPGFLFCR